MFKKWFITLVLFIILPLAGKAQMFDSIDLQVNTGPALPLKAHHFEKYWSGGIHFGGGLETSVNEMIVLKWDAAFNTFFFRHEPWKTDLIQYLTDQGQVIDDANGVVVNGANRYILETALSAKFFPMSKQQINPFLALGAGIIHMNTNQLIINNNGPEFFTETVPYFSAALGSEFSYWKDFKLFGQLIYKYALTKDENNLGFPMDFKDSYQTQETHLLGIEFGIIFALVNQ